MNGARGFALRWTTFACLWLAEETLAWPWIEDPGTINVSLSASRINTRERFSDGSVYAKAGEKIPVFNETPGRLIVRALDMGIGFVFAKGWQTGLEAQWAHVKMDWDLGPADATGFGDTRAWIKTRLPTAIPAVLFAGSVLPTGKSSLAAQDASLGEGFWIPFVGADLGYRPLRRIYLYSTQSFHFWTLKEIRGGTRHRGPSWSGDANILLAFARLQSWGSLGYLVSAPNRFEGPAFPDRPEISGLSHWTVKTGMGTRVGAFTLRGELSYPLAGVGIPACPKVSVGAAWQTHLYRRKP